MDNEGSRIALVGARGTVGREILALLEERHFSVRQLALFGVKRAVGEKIEFQGREIRIEPLTEEAFRGVEVAFFASHVDERFIESARRSGAVVIECSGAREAREMLCVPEINADRARALLRSRKPAAGFANPSAAAIQLAVVLHPLKQRAGLKRVVVSSYESVSGAGQKGINELSEQVRALFSQKAVETSVFPRQIAFNCLPQVGDFREDGATDKEELLERECRELLDAPALKLSCTRVYVPAFHCYAQAVNVETESPLSPDEARALLRQSPGLIVLDAAEEYPTGFAAAGSDAVHVGRIRQDRSAENGLQLWIVADNLRKGAALNAVQTAEIVLRELAAQ